MIATAYHEAGHALVSYVLGKGFKDVTVVPFEDYLGAVTALCDSQFLASMIDSSNDFILPQSILDIRVRFELMVLYAGYFSEKEYGSDNQEGAYSDIMMINEFVKSYCETEKDAEDLIIYCMDRTREILTDNWFKLRILANELLVKKTMSYTEVDDLFKRISKKSPSDLRNLMSTLK